MQNKEKKKKSLIRRIVPNSIVRLFKKDDSAYKFSEYEKLPLEKVFDKIYSESVWGVSENPDDKYCSGSGSRDPLVVTSYVDTISKFIQNCEIPHPSIVDLGCGDFFVGEKIRPLCGHYIACDIVEPLIEFNKVKYKHLDVDFLRLDLTKDSLPAGDIVFIRQVPQHLSNAQIKHFVQNIHPSYKYLVVTEHIPSSPSFVPNIDTLSGPDNRLRLKSGVVLTSHPFNLKIQSESILCDILSEGAIIRTIAYKLV